MRNMSTMAADSGSYFQGNPFGFVMQGNPLNVHLSGTYPHAEWQGDRIEGFVISTGQLHSSGASQQVRAVTQTGMTI